MAENIPFKKGKSYMDAEIHMTMEASQNSLNRELDYYDVVLLGINRVCRIFENFLDLLHCVETKYFWFHMFLTKIP